MDLVSLTVGLPFAPLRGLLALARMLQEEAEQELYDPTQVRRQLEEIDSAAEMEELPDEVAEAEQQRALAQLAAEQATRSLKAAEDAKKLATQRADEAARQTVLAHEASELAESQRLVAVAKIDWAVPVAWMLSWVARATAVAVVTLAS